LLVPQQNSKKNSSGGIHACEETPCPVLTAFTVIVCRCGGTMGPVIEPIMAADGSTIGSCKFKQEVSELSEESEPDEDGAAPVMIRFGNVPSPVQIIVG
jgi:hypothetical protein